MQTIPNQLLTAIKRGYEIPVTPQVIAEWNYNYFVPTTVTNADAPADNWVENDLYFPLDSITSMLRPKSGIFYAFTNESYTVGNMDQNIPANRFYTVDKNNHYKYWVTPTRSSELDNQLQTAGTATYNILNVVPVVVYSQSVKTNKIRVTFNLGSLPVEWKIYLKISGVFVEIAHNPTIDLITGECELWYNGTSWTATQSNEESVFVTATEIKIDVDQVDTPNSRLQLIEMACCREIDITNRVIDYEINMSMDDDDFIHPVGTISANDGKLTLSNYDLEIDYGPAGNFAGLLNVWCQVRMYVDYNLTLYGGSSSNKIRVGTMYTNEWRQTDESEFDIELFDLMKFLQVIKCPPVLIENQSFATIVSRILDMVGCDNYELQASDFDSTANIKYFWTDGEETIYEVFQRLCHSYMSAIYADEFGIIQLITKDKIANQTDTSVWNFLAEQSGLDIPDVISLKKQYEIVANNVTVKYKKREAKVDALDLSSQPLTSKVWGADDAIVLRASPITRDIGSTGLTIVNPISSVVENNSVWIPPLDAATWPYKGQVNVEGEVFRYSGKGYFVWDHDTSTKQEILIYSEDDKRKYDLQTYNTDTNYGLNPEQQNSFTGRLYITERSLNGTDPAKHSTQMEDDWSMLNMWLQSAPAGKYFDWGGSFGGFIGNWKARAPWYRPQSKWSTKDSHLTCNNFDSPGYNHCAVALRNFPNNNAMREYGTRVKFTSYVGHAGIISHISDSAEYDPADLGPLNIVDGTKAYMVNVISTNVVDNILGRALTNEIFVELKLGDNVYRMPTLYSENIRGVKWTIENEKWYDIEAVYTDDVLINGVNATTVEVFIDGQFVETFYSTVRIHPTEWAGVFARGTTSVDFDHFYATNISSPDFSSKDDDLFTAFTTQLPPGTNTTQMLNFSPLYGWDGYNSVLSIASASSVTIHSMKFVQDPSPSGTNYYTYRPGTGYVGPSINTNQLKVINYGSKTIAADRRHMWQLLETTIAPSSVIIKYTATKPVSVCLEQSRFNSLEYGVEYNNFNADTSIWDISKGGFFSNRFNNLIFKLTLYDNVIGPDGLSYNRALFFDEFGSIAHEIREFDVQLDVSPAKSVKVFFDNEKCQLIDQQYHPVRGQFTLVNTSRKNEIINGTEQIDETNSIEHTLMLYGYVLEEKGEQEKTVKDELNIKQRGETKLDIDADWIFTDEQAEELASWIVEHWASPMDTIQIEVFANSFVQIGDKVTVKYTRLGIDDDILFIVTSARRGFNDNAFNSSLTLRRVR